MKASTSPEPQKVSLQKIASLLADASISATTPAGRDREVEEWSKKLADRMLRTQESQRENRRELTKGFLEELIHAAKTLGWQAYAQSGAKQISPDGAGHVKASLVIDWFAQDADRPHFHSLYSALKEKLGPPPNDTQQAGESNALDSLAQVSPGPTTPDYLAFRFVVARLEKPWPKIGSDLRNSKRYPELHAARRKDGQSGWDFAKVTAWGIKNGRLDPSWQDPYSTNTVLGNLGRP